MTPGEAAVMNASVTCTRSALGFSDSASFFQ